MSQHTSRPSPRSKRPVKTITRAPKFDGTWVKLDWKQTAFDVAVILDRIPTEPPIDRIALGAKDAVGLFGKTLHSEPDPELERRLEWALNSLGIIEKHLERYAKTGTVWADQPDGISLVEAWAQVAVVRQSRWITPEVKRTLPIHIASIARTVGVESSMKARAPRARAPNALRIARLRTMKIHPGLSWKKLLDQMTGDGLVQAWDAKTIRWQDANGKEHETPTSTFRNWKAIG